MILAAAGFIVVTETYSLDFLATTEVRYLPLTSAGLPAPKDPALPRRSSKVSALMLDSLFQVQTRDWDSPWNECQLLMIPHE